MGKLEFHHKRASTSVLQEEENCLINWLISQNCHRSGYWYKGNINGKTISEMGPPHKYSTELKVDLNKMFLKIRLWLICRSPRWADKRTDGELVRIVSWFVYL